MVWKDCFRAKIVRNNEFVNYSPSKLAMEQLAKNLVNTYPSFGDPMKGGKGWRMWFNHSIHASAASGFLEERLKNQRKRLAKKKVINSFDDESAQYVVNWDSDNDEGMATRLMNLH